LGVHAKLRTGVLVRMKGLKRRRKESMKVATWALQKAASPFGEKRRFVGNEREGT